jgi:hypothetical protein
MTSASPASRSLVAALLAVACEGRSSAQVVRDPLGPVQCFRIADGKNLAEQSSIQMCAGALSAAPGQCYAAAIEQFHELSSQQIVELCTGATNLTPLSCYAHLATENYLTEGQIIAYCATACPLGPPPPQASSPACLEAAVDRTGLSLQSAGELCLGSHSAGPVQCFVAGLDLHKVAESKLVELCRESLHCQFYNTSPSY